MYKQELDTKLKSKNLPSSLLLYGQSDYVRTTYADFICSKYGSSEETIKMYFEEYNYKSAKSHLSQSSLFGGNNILLIKNDKAIAKKELDSLIELCNSNEGNFLVYEYFGSDANAKKMQKSFSKKNGADFVRFFQPKQYEAVEMLDKKAKKLELNIDKYTLGYLYNLEYESMSLAINDLYKLQNIPEEKITTKEIDTYIHGLNSIDTSQLIDEIMNKKDVIQILKTIHEEGSLSELDIITAIQRHFKTLLMFYLYIKANGEVNVKNILGYNPPINLTNQLSSSSIKLNTSKYYQIIRLLSKTELDLKSLQSDKTTILISSIIKLQSFL